MAKVVCLIGFMGSGKTTVGQALAQKLGWDWIDLDAEIVKGEDKTIANIFAEKGENYFRSLETKYLKDALQREEIIISTGGGIIVTPQNIQLLKASNTFYLDWEFETLYTRIAGDKERPLVTSYEEVYTRYKCRKPLYEAASKSIIVCDNQAIDEVVAQINQQIECI